MTASTSNDTNLIVKNSAIEDADHCQEYFKTDGVSHLNQGNVTTADKPNDLNADCSAYNASGGDSHKQRVSFPGSELTLGADCLDKMRR